MMKIEIGREYKTRGGWMAKVDSQRKEGGYYVTHEGNGSGWFHYPDGSICTSNRCFDLVPA